MIEPYQNILRDLTLDLLENKISVVYKHSSTVDGFGGFFCGQTRELVVATRRPYYKWIPTFVHEYCHFKQWKDKSKLWDFNGNDSFNWGDYLDGEIELTNKQKDRLCKKQQKLELDCENRALKVLTEYNAPKLDDYILSANVYVLSYQILKEVGFWYNGFLQAQKFKGIVPSDRLIEDVTKLPKGFFKKVLRVCYSKPQQKKLKKLGYKF